MRLIFVCFAFASVLVNADTLPSDVDLLEVSKSPGWQRLLYLDPGTESSKSNTRILDPAFYLSGSDHIDPLEELTASVKLMFTEVSDINNTHPICRFPARYLYLSSAFSNSGAIDPFVECDSLRTWAEIDSFSQILIVKVDGYYGNPASSFGHLIVRFSNKNYSPSLLDRSINFGARVPPNELMPTYIFKGITGGYVASFFLDNFYKQDLTYTNTEFRDMWNYELNLSDDQKKLFVAHLWELFDHPSTYYFIKNNCAYAIAELLEVAVGLEFVTNSTPYYAPAHLFHDLDKYDSRSPGSIIKSRTYIPSKDKILSAIMSELSKPEAEFIRGYISDEIDNLSLISQFRDSDRQTFLLEVLIEYYDYMIAGYPEQGSNLTFRRNEVIKARLRLPAGKKLEPIKIDTPPLPPGQTARTTKLGIGVIHSQKQNSTTGTLSFTPFSIEPLDSGNHILSELTALRTEIEITEKVSFKEFSLIKVSQRTDLRDYSLSGWPISWSVDIGTNCVSNCNRDEGLYADMGIGQSIGIGSFLNSAMISASLNGSDYGITTIYELAYPERDKLSFLATFEKKFSLRDVKWEPADLLMVGRYSFNPSYSIELSSGIADQHATSAITLNWHMK